MFNNGDRSWMYNRVDHDGNLTEHFEVGVEYFLNYAFSQRYSGRKVKCPCSKCTNARLFTRDVILRHLYSWGFVSQYMVWTAHGESGVYSRHENENENVGESSQSNNPPDLRDMVNDMFGGQFEHMAANDVENNEATYAGADEFFEMLHAAETPVGEGLEMTKLEWISDFMNIKTLHKISIVACDKLIQQEHQFLPPAARESLPDNFYEMKRFMKRLGLGVKTFDVCYNNCFLFYGEHESSTITTCPECGDPRYEIKPNSSKKGKLVARKKLWYFPLTPRLQRLYMSRTTSEHMTWHTNCRGDTDEMIHPAHGEAWQDFDRRYPSFAGEARNVRLGLCTDGFAPFDNGSQYSCWPVLVTPYNLPPDLCMRQEYIFLSLLISGPKSPGKDLDLFLRPLIDELKSLWDVGVPTYDSFRKETFQMRASLLWTISDFPAYGMLSQWSTHGKLTCPICMEKTKSFQLKHGRKTTFFDCHRRFLRYDHPFRFNVTDFYKNKPEHDPPFQRRTGPKMYKHVEHLPPAGFGLSRGTIDGFGDDHNWCRQSIFWELPYWSTNLIRHNLDIMHCEKNFFDNIKNTVMDDPEKTKDNLNARKDLMLYTLRSELFPVTGRDGRDYKRKAKYCLTRDQKRVICEWLCKLRFPDGYSSNISRCVHMQQLRLTGMKSHDCHVFMQRLIPIAFRGFVDDTVWDPLVEVSNFFRSLCATVLKKSDMARLETTIVETICKLEQIFQPAFFDSMEHLAIHLPWEAKVGGPAQYRWMYPFERRMFEFKNSVGNKARVEGSIAQAYLTSELTNFLCHYFKHDVETRANRLNRNETRADPSLAFHISVFNACGATIGQARPRYLNLDEYRSAELYILLNCVEVEPYLRLFDEEKCVGLSDYHIHETRNTKFVRWFKKKVTSSRFRGDPRLRSLGHGPNYRVNSYDGYKINGLRFHTEEHAVGKKKMNCGVCVKASAGGTEDIFYYGMLQEVLEVDYPGEKNCRAILFKCVWYDISPDGLYVHPVHRLIEIDPRRRLPSGEADPYILASQAQHVYYTPYACESRRSVRRGWWAVVHTRARHIVDTSSMKHPSISIPIPPVFQETNVPTVGVVVDFSGFNVRQLADDEFEEADAPVVEPESSNSDDDEDDDDDDNGNGQGETIVSDDSD